MFNLKVVIFSLIFTAIVAVDSEQDSYCNRKWPELDLLLPVGLSSTSNRNYEWNDMFINSMATYWPTKRSNTSVVIVLDEEQKGSDLEHTYITRVIDARKNETNYPQIKVKYHEKTIGYRNGHDRQQHLMFYPELFTKKEYVGYVDTDAFLTANIDREDIFENGKPIVHGRIGIFRKYYHPQYANATYKLLGMEEPMLCMSYFPVVMKTAHLKELRDYVAERTGMSFDEAFATYAMSSVYSQFNIMCTYAFWKKQHEYSWAIHDTDPNWNGIVPKPFYGQWGEKWIFSSSSFAVKPFIAMHYRYHQLAGAFNLQQVMARSMCHTRPNDNPIGLDCTEYLTRHPYHEHMFRFEDADYTKVLDKETLISAQLERQKRFDNCDISYGKEQFWKSLPGKTMHDVQQLLLGQ